MRFMGYRRPDGRVGVRNHVVVVSTVMCSSTVTGAIADATGSVPVTHEGGCLELGPARDHTERVLRGVVSHPNVAAALVVGLGCEQIQAESLAAAARGKPIRLLEVRDAGGTEHARSQGVELAQELLAEIEGSYREPAELHELTCHDQARRVMAAAARPLLGPTMSIWSYNHRKFISERERHF